MLTDSNRMLTSVRNASCSHLSAAPVLHWLRQVWGALQAAELLIMDVHQNPVWGRGVLHGAPAAVLSPGPRHRSCASSPPITATLMREHFSFWDCWTSHTLRKLREGSEVESRKTGMCWRPGPVSWGPVAAEIRVGLRMPTAATAELSISQKQKLRSGKCRTEWPLGAVLKDRTEHDLQALGPSQQWWPDGSLPSVQLTEPAALEKLVGKGEARACWKIEEIQCGCK